MYSNRLQPALQNLLQCVVRFFHPRSSCTTHISADIFSGQKITRKANVVPENMQLYQVVRFLHPRSSCTMTHVGGRSENNINASCMKISGRRTKHLDIFCRVTGFTSDFLSFIVVKLIRFFHGAIQLISARKTNCSKKLPNVSDTHTTTVFERP